MSVMLSKTYAALVAAGAGEDKAREAAEEIAGFDKRLIRLEVMVAINLGLSLGILAKLFTS